MKTIGLRIKSVRHDKDLRTTTVLYDLTHCGEKTTLTLDVGLTIDPYATGENVCASITLETPKVDSPEKALDALADWLSRAAEALRERKNLQTIPFST